jgi:hypothetical protein
MGFDGKYGRVTTEHGDIPEDEPVIVFRAQDKLLPMVLAFYKTCCKSSGSPERHLDLIDESYEGVVQWQTDNQDKVKQPDSERSREWRN